MFMLISPAKTFDFKTPVALARHTQPAWLGESEKLISGLKRLSLSETASLMGISDPLAAKSLAAHEEWGLPFTPENARQAVLAFAGDVYKGLNALQLGIDDLVWAQTRLGILSGLYGLLRPLDLIQPYRLEMGVKWLNERGENLYAFWGETLKNAVREAVLQSGSLALVNLASEEYFKAVGGGCFPFPLIQIIFEDWKDGYRVISLYAKRARGLMARYAITNRIDEPLGLKNFDLEGYAFDPAASQHHRWVFRRKIDRAAGHF